MLEILRLAEGLEETVLPVYGRSGVERFVVELSIRADRLGWIVGRGFG